MSEDCTEKTTGKYKELFLLAKEGLKEEDNRYDRIEDKASKFIPVLLFLLGYTGFFIKWMLDKPLVWESMLGRLGIAFILLTIASILICGVQLYRCLYSQKVYVLRTSDKDVEFFDKNELDEIYRGYVKKINLGRNENTKITDKKAYILIAAYTWLLISAVLLILVGMVYIMDSCSIICHVNIFKPNTFAS